MTGGFLFLILAFLAPAVPEPALPPAEAKGVLVIEVENITTTNGIIWVGIYDSAPNFLVKEKSIVQGFKIKRPGRMKMTFPNLPYGSYAVGLFHDTNGNGEMDTNVMGVPIEPFAFSGKPKSKWRLPRFDEVKFDFYQDGQVLRSYLKRWRDH